MDKAAPSVEGPALGRIIDHLAARMKNKPRPGPGAGEDALIVRSLPGAGISWAVAGSTHRESNLTLP
ncbi:hypothetical protein [Methylorubrum thiocyanatum]|uniref:Uncharacterized protein n=1 Tax=Methylorubrum thiocyanatum TaxID=47958 RepID=A0AA40RYC5_9HYPH|nr:hypothetical protein [Methylorubrum thiocyanatum]MBA8911258.1 hypothetical protein [Methylorubrum thiocyanatum]